MLRRAAAGLVLVGALGLTAGSAVAAPPAVGAVHPRGGHPPAYVIYGGQVVGNLSGPVADATVVLTEDGALITGIDLLDVDAVNLAGEPVDLERRMRNGWTVDISDPVVETTPSPTARRRLRPRPRAGHPRCGAAATGGARPFLIVAGSASPSER